MGKIEKEKQKSRTDNRADMKRKAEQGKGKHVCGTGGVAVCEERLKRMKGKKFVSE